MSRWLPFQWILLVSMIALPAGAVQAEEPRYLAVFTNGNRVEGTKLSGWHEQNSQPKLDNTGLFTAGVLRAFVDLQPPPEALDAASFRPPGYVELIGGDRLTGAVIGYSAGESIAGAGSLHRPHLLVRPATELHYPADPRYERVRVLTRFVQRIVLDGSTSRRVNPGTAVLRDGRSLAFRTLRWNEASVRILGDEGIQSIELADLAELHLPREDWWDAWYEQLALLTAEPDQRDDRLIRLATHHGVVATGSRAWLRIANNGNSSDPDHWYHGMQPAWSLDPLWLRFSTIASRLNFAPHEMPLSLLEPDEVVQKSLLGGGLRWQRDRNVQGGPLVSGGMRHAWGLGVHPLCELTWQLPPVARSFRTRIGLDRLAGRGGCVRARVFLGAERQKLFESDHLIGSDKGVDTGELFLDPARHEDLRLTLQAHPAHYDRPAGADPLDIRDSLDWLEPLVMLDAGKVAEEIQARRLEWLPAWDGWSVRSLEQPNSFRLAPVWETMNSTQPAFHTAVIVGDQGVHLSRELNVQAEAPWLLVGARAPGNESGGVLHVRVEGNPLAEAVIPNGPPGATKPLAVSLAPYVGRKVNVEIEHQPGGANRPVIWTDILLTGRLPTIARLYEDDPDGVFPAPLDEGLVSVAKADPYSGTACLRIQPADGNAAVLRQLDQAVRERPALGQFRFLRLAVRMNGEARLAMELRSANDAEEQRPRRYFLGDSDPPLENAVRALGSSPQQWTLVTRDLFADFGELDMKELALIAYGEGSVFVDHVYLARRQEDFDDIGLLERPSPQPDDKQLAAFAEAIQKAGSALVEIDVEGRRGVGVIIDAEGRIATTGYVTVAPGEPAKITLADGRQLSGKTLGIERDPDAGMIQLEGEGPWPFIERAEGVTPGGEGGRWAALTAVNKPGEPRRVGAAVVRFHRLDDDKTWVSLLFDRRYSGSPLVDPDGKLVGLVSRPYGPGGTVATPSRSHFLRREHMQKGEVRGAWPMAVTPHLGLNAATNGDHLEVIGVREGGPAAQAGIQPGDVLRRFAGQEVRRLQELVQALAQRLPDEEVTVQIDRNGKSMNVNVKLDRRG